MKNISKLVASAACILALSGLSLRAQYLGDQPLGFTGLQAGSQPPPGLYVTVPLYFRHSDVSIYNAQGNEILKNATGDLNLFMLPALQWVMPVKIFGANVGVAYMQWIDNGVLDLVGPGFHRSTNYAFGDIYVQPLVLGWHTPHADVTAGYAFFAPTGGGTAGRHMWVDEIDFGTTLYLDKAKKLNVSTMMMYDFNQNKNNTNVTVGDIVTLSGGAGVSFLKGAAHAGAAYGRSGRRPTIAVPTFHLYCRSPMDEFSESDRNSTCRSLRKDRTWVWFPSAIFGWLALRQLWEGMHSRLRLRSRGWESYEGG